MSSTVGQIEKQTQARIVALLRDRLHYTYLGNWLDRAGNANIEPERLTAWLAKQGVAPALASRALFESCKRWPATPAKPCMTATARCTA